MKTKILTIFRSGFIFKTAFFLMSLLLLIGQYGFKDKENFSPATDDIESAESLPIPLELFYSLREDFNRAYLITANNTAIEKTLKTKWEDLSQYIDMDKLRNKNDTGIALHYIILRDASNNPYFSYAITYARIDPLAGITTMPFADTLEYIVMTDTGMNIINSSQLAQFKQHYKDSVRVYNDFPTVANYKIDTLGHPQMTYFDGDNFVEFYENNMNNAPEENLYLYFFNGARYNDSIKRLFKN
jgi:hypothetical protein